MTDPGEPAPYVLYSLMEVARALGVTRQRVGQLIKAGLLDAQRHGNIWLVEERDLRRFTELKRPPPPKKKPPGYTRAMRAARYRGRRERSLVERRSSGSDAVPP